MGVSTAKKVLLEKTGNEVVLTIKNGLHVNKKAPSFLKVHPIVCSRRLKSTVHSRYVLTGLSKSNSVYQFGYQGRPLR